MNKFEKFEKREYFDFEECKEKGLRIYQCPPFQFSLVALVVLTGVTIIAFKVALNTINAILILVVFGFILSLVGWFIVKKYKARFN